jgi:hypothetical protein
MLNILIFINIEYCLCYREYLGKLRIKNLGIAFKHKI